MLNYRACTRSRQGIWVIATGNKKSHAAIADHGGIAGFSSERKSPSTAAQRITGHGIEQRNDHRAATFIRFRQ